MKAEKFAVKEDVNNRVKDTIMFFVVLKLG